ncbi:MAG TPA: phosphotransferase family protein [Nocardioidaceae bacterium]|nr:phosphotransferase family protein [Nocardioidaceae bacterium]
MALINTLDPATVASRLAAWLPSVIKGAEDVVISDVQVSASNGMSSESALLVGEWTVDGVRETRGLVARVAPTQGGLFPSYDLEREAKVMTALSVGTDAAVPKVVAHERTGEVLGAPFLLVERVYGEVPADDPPYTMTGWVLELSAEQQATLFDNALRVLADIAKADWKALDLGSLAPTTEGATPTDQLLTYWRDFYTWAGAGRRSATIDAAWEWLDANRPSADSNPVVCWGDARLGNLMFGPDQQVTGVFDWEMAQLGPHEFDLGYLLFTNRVWSDGLGVPLPAGFPEPAAAVARFEELSGLEVRDIDWWEAFAGVRCAILLMRVGCLLIELGAMPADAPMPIANPASVALAALLGLPTPGTETGWITGSR